MLYHTVSQAKIYPKVLMGQPKLLRFYHDYSFICDYFSVKISDEGPETSLYSAYKIWQLRSSLARKFIFRNKGRRIGFCLYAEEYQTSSTRSCTCTHTCPSLFFRHFRLRSGHELYRLVCAYFLQTVYCSRVIQNSWLRLSLDTSSSKWCHFEVIHTICVL